jgi:hypothetical protein
MHFSYPDLIREFGKFLLTHARRTTLGLAPSHDVVCNPQFFATSRLGIVEALIIPSLSLLDFGTRYELIYSYNYHSEPIGIAPLIS